MRIAKSARFLALTCVFCAYALSEERNWAATVYAARVSGERTWQDIIKDPLGTRYVDAYLLSAALSREYAKTRSGALRFEAEGQLVYNFGDQDHWEINAVPIVARWGRFPWSHRVATSAAFGLGLSYAFDLPEVEVELENDTEHLLVYWMAEITAGPATAPWQVALRLHHRSVAWGLMGEDGGVNAIGLGVRYQF